MENTRNPAQLSIIKSFVDEWKLRTSEKSLLYLRLSPFGVFSTVDFGNSPVVFSSREINIDSKFDLIIGDLPFGMNQVDLEYQGAKSMTTP